MLRPRLLFVFTCPCMGLMLFSVSKAQLWLTGLSLLMPFAFNNVGWTLRGESSRHPESV